MSKQHEEETGHAGDGIASLKYYRGGKRLRLTTAIIRDASSSPVETGFPAAHMSTILWLPCLMLVLILSCTYCLIS